MHGLPFIFVRILLGRSGSKHKYSVTYSNSSKVRSQLPHSPLLLCSFPSPLQRILSLPSNSPPQLKFELEASLEASLEMGLLRGVLHQGSVSIDALRNAECYIVEMDPNRCILRSQLEQDNELLHCSLEEF
ncbi:uncharacterized protein LOC144545700 [Carex rostrata]